MSMNRTWTSEERDLLKELQRYIGKKKKTSNPPTPKASAWQALTCLAVAKAKEERPMKGGSEAHCSFEL